MSSASVHRTLKSKNQEDQSVMDEILQVVSEQRREFSLSSTDYQFTKGFSKHVSPVLNRDNRSCSSDSTDTSSFCSDFSYSPPSTQQSSDTSLSEDTGKDMLRKCRLLDKHKSSPNCSRISKLPPLNPQRIRRPSRPSPEQYSPIETFEDNNRGTPVVRPKSAHGRRTISKN